MKQHSFQKRTVHIATEEQQHPPGTLIDTWGWIDATQTALDKIDGELGELDKQLQEAGSLRNSTRQTYREALAALKGDWRTRRPLRHKYYYATEAHGLTAVKRAEKRLERTYASQAIEDAHSGLVNAIVQTLLRDGRVPENAVNIVVYYTHPAANIVAYWKNRRFSISPDGVVYAQIQS